MPISCVTGKRVSWGQRKSKMLDETPSYLHLPFVTSEHWSKLCSAVCHAVIASQRRLGAKDANEIRTVWLASPAKHLPLSVTLINGESLLLMAATEARLRGIPKTGDTAARRRWLGDMLSFYHSAFLFAQISSLERRIITAQAQMGACVRRGTLSVGGSTSFISLCKSSKYTLYE